MKKLALGLFAFALALAFSPARDADAQGVGAGLTIPCNKIASATPAAAGTVQVIPGVAGHVYAVCGWHVTSNQSAVTTFQFEYGTQGGPCTSPTTVTPALSVTSTAPSADHIEFASWSAPAGAQVCVVSTGTTVGQQVLLFYADLS